MKGSHGGMRALKLSPFMHQHFISVNVKTFLFFSMADGPKHLYAGSDMDSLLEFSLLI